MSHLATSHSRETPECVAPAKVAHDVRPIAHDFGDCRDRPRASGSADGGPAELREREVTEGGVGDRHRRYAAPERGQKAPDDAATERGRDQQWVEPGDRVA